MHGPNTAELRAWQCFSDASIAFVARGTSTLTKKSPTPSNNTHEQNTQAIIHKKPDPPRLGCVRGGSKALQCCLASVGVVALHLVGLNERVS
jgi:hypothetical protein